MQTLELTCPLRALGSERQYVTLAFVRVAVYVVEDENGRFVDFWGVSARDADDLGLWHWLSEDSLLYTEAIGRVILEGLVTGVWEAYYNEQ